MSRFCVVRKKDGLTSKCFSTKARARKLCARLNRLTGRGRWTVVIRRYWRASSQIGRATIAQVGRSWRAEGYR